VKAGITQGKTEAGLFCLSNPMLTALDVVTFERLCGGIDHVAAVVKKLVPLITVKDIRNCATNYRPLTSIQRLGFIMEKGEAPKQILNALCGVLEKITTSTVVLTPFGPRQGKRNATWNILVNHKIEEPHDF
jgi:predicted transcriptional regulator of viral defense system